ncbi:thioredoxin [Paenibacillus jilunlii]|uniref:Thioredoxin n=1 Tax=Paenibacillus jilunlii TaxID=682956 RepID=A0A1G9GDQ0_9BACL|nr:thioredoxin [Paenibacillus jilunlii]KWX71429.1 thioredoxin [Paenibacillus jilunlii]SDK98423.1 thioredoxin [Paenibacillus jilunlii]
MAIQHATDQNFKQLVQGNGVTVVNFWASWCGPCRMFAPVLEAFANEAEGKVSVIKVNVDENPVTSAQYGIMSIPSTLIFQNGTLKYKEAGILPAGTLRTLVSGEAG